MGKNMIPSDIKLLCTLLTTTWDHSKYTQFAAKTDIVIMYQLKSTGKVCNNLI